MTINIEDTYFCHLVRKWFSKHFELFAASRSCYALKQKASGDSPASLKGTLVK